MKTHYQGLNIVGYTDAMTGLGEAVRLNIKAAKTLDIPLNIVNYEHLKRTCSYEINMPYSISLVQISLHDLDTFFSVMEPSFFNDTYTILFLVWESEHIPSKLKKHVNLFNELWTASTYCKELFQNVYKGPIITVPHPVEVSLEPIRKKDAIPFFNKDKFSFLFIFSYHSSMERKNPFFLMDAFSKTFDPQEPVELIIKTVGAERFKRESKRFQGYASGKTNIKIFNLDLDKNAVNHLINDCDCYVSMHHSEGFGLTLAEAMFLGKPTVATNYSGNTEFMNDSNSFLVDFELGFIENPDNNFSYQTLWAHPDMQDTIDTLRSVYENRTLRNEKARHAKHSVKDALSFQTVGTLIKNRLNELYSKRDDLTIQDRRQEYLMNQLQWAHLEIAKHQREIRRMKKNVLIYFILNLKDLVRSIKGRK